MQKMLKVAQNYMRFVRFERQAFSAKPEFLLKVYDIRMYASKTTTQNRHLYQKEINLRTGM